MTNGNGLKWVRGALLAWCVCSAAAQPIAVDGGLVEGVQQGALRVHKGIPFAAPPVGDLRWRAPQPVKPWTGIKPADRYGPSCPQRGNNYPPDAPTEATSEDCLTLNVWAHAAAQKKLPVMVWIHGGGLQNGSGSVPLYEGDRLAQRGVVVVSFNYRLGALGFLGHPALSRESAQAVSGNYGLLDQIAALQWVRRHIAAFGGDPDRVTVFGQSSGAISINALVASPLAQGLFHRVIAQSGSLLEPIELDAGFSLRGAEQAGERFAARAGVSSLAELRRLPVDEVLKTRFNPQFNVDGHVLPASPHRAYGTGTQARVDLLLGSNTDEGTWFLPDRPITPGGLRAELERHFPAWLVALLGTGPVNDDAQARAAAAAVEGDLRFRWGMWAWARLAAESGGERSVFFYQFARRPALREGASYRGLGATHGIEMPYVFDRLDSLSADWASADRELASTIPAYWVNFATTGNPNGPGLPHWPGYRESRGQALHLGDTVVPRALADEHRLLRIDRIYATARFVDRHPIVVAGGALVLVAAILWLLAIAARRGWRRWRTRAAKWSSQQTMQGR